MASVLLLHAWWGRTPLFVELGERFARAGYTVEVPDLYGDGRTADTIAEAEALSSGADQDAMTGRAAGALARLEPPVSAIGFSLGAAVALQLLCNAAPLRAAVLYYGTGFIPEALAPPVAVLGHFASNDPFESREYIEAVERGLADAAHTRRSTPTPARTTGSRSPTDPSTTRRPRRSRGSGRSRSCARSCPRPDGRLRRHEPALRRAG